MEGGASHLYGSGALSGIINIFEQQRRDQLAADIDIGNENAPRGSLLASHALGRWVVSGAAEGFRTDGYYAVLPPDRGAVDRPVTLRYGTGTARVDRRFGRGTNTFASVSLLNEGRGNGTALQINNMRLVEVRAGADVNAGPGRLSLRAYGTAERYAQTFSAIASNRSSESLTTWQRVPAQQEGEEAHWTGIVFGRNAVAAGGEVRDLRGVSNEVNFARNPATFASAGGHQLLLGAYGADSVRVHSANFTVAARVDRWSNVPLSNIGERDGYATSPHFGAVVPLRAGFVWTGSAYKSFRAPTLNELYRNFRVGNVLTLANATLTPEHLEGVESGVAYARSNIVARANFLFCRSHRADRERNGDDHAATDHAAASEPGQLALPRP
jgi:outer membrane cobalamin receptor